MKLVFKPLVILLTIYTTCVEANETGCSSISFQHSNINNRTVLVELLNSNNHVPKRIDNRLYSLDFVSENTNFILEEGDHTLLTAAWSKRDYRKWMKKVKVIQWENIGAFSYLYKGKAINSNVQLAANQHYTFRAQKIDEVNYKLTIVKVEPKLCNVNNETILKAQAAVNKQDDTFPLKLENKLRGVMTRIAAYQSNTVSKQGNIVNLKIGLNFGVIADWNGDEKNMKILLVKPFSQANKVGLLSGDLITGLNDEVFKEQKSGVNDMSDVIKEMALGEKYTFNIIRQGQKINVSGIMDIDVVPGTVYRFPTGKNETTVIGDTKLTPMLKAEYQNVVVEITNYLKMKKATETGYYQIERLKKQITSFGVVGSVMNVNNKGSFLVSKVVTGSYADNIGVQASDEIIDFNKSGSIYTLTNEVSFRRRLGKENTIKIIRNGSEKILSKKLEPNYDIAFTLQLNLDDKDNLTAYIGGQYNQNRILMKNIKWNLKGTRGWSDRQRMFRITGNHEGSLESRSTPAGGRTPVSSSGGSSNKSKN